MSETTDDRLLPGRLPPGLLRELLPDAAERPPEVRLDPAREEEARAIGVPEGTLVGANTGLIHANDVAETGVAPRWFLRTDSRI